MRRRRQLVALALLLACALDVAWATDPARGAQLFATPPAVGELACADCHSENPTVNNFGNIWSGRNAVGLIQRAVNLNTGGMGVFNRYYGASDLADIAAFLGQTPAAVVFAETLLGQASVAQRVTISASSKTSLDGLALGVQGDFMIEASDCPVQLPPFGSCHVDLVFTPTAGGARSGSLQVAHNGLPSPALITLTGQGRDRPPAIVELSASAMTFGPSAVGVPGDERQVRLYNRSAEVVTLGDMGLAGDDFVVTGGNCRAGQPLISGRHCMMAVAFRPTAAGSRSGQLALRHDGVGAVSRVDLAGDGRAGPQGNLVVEPAVLRWGAQTTGGTSAVQTVSLRNAGTAALRLATLGLSQPGFSIEPGGCAVGGVLAPGAACALGLRFVPARSGVLAGELVLGHDGAGASRVVLWGRGGTGLVTSPAPMPGSLLWVDAARLDFPGASRRSVLLVNRGAVVVPITAVDVIGTAAAAFSRSGGCDAGTPLLPGAGCEIVLDFMPAAAGSQRASLLVTTPQDSVMLSLHGDAQAEVAAGPAPSGALGWRHEGASPSWPRTDVGAQSAPTALQLFNGGTQAVTVQAFTLAGPAEAEFRIAGGSCQAGGVLAAGASCSVTVAFAPAAAGIRQATLAATIDGRTDVVLSMQAQSLAPAQAQLRLEPPAVVFAVGTPGVGARQRVQLQNQGAAPLPLRGISVQGSGYVLLPTADQGCAAAGMDLLPGQACAVDVQWTGGVDAALGGRLVIDIEGSASSQQVPLSVLEDAAGRSNAGGGGAMDLAVLAGVLLALAALAAARRESAHD